MKPGESWPAVILITQQYIHCCLFSLTSWVLDSRNAAFGWKTVVPFKENWMNALSQLAV